MPCHGLQPLFGMSGAPVVAGPCSAESPSQVMQAARAVAGLGVGVLRAGAWKPRTKPGGFEGHGPDALRWLADAKAATGLLVATEVATPGHLRQAVDAGIDGVWIGARTTSNPFAVQDLADALAALDPDTRARLTVMVKNPISPDLELWIGAIERVYAAGIRRLGAIHRGFGSYGRTVYRNEPRWAIPIELRRRIPGLPVLCDPSHIAGRRDLVAPVARQAYTLGFDGLCVECHPDPDSALSDAAQQLTPDALAALLADLRRPDAIAHPDSLADLRRQIDEIDDELLALLGRRMAVASEIGRYKKDRNISVLQPDRYNDLMERRASQAELLDLSPDFVRTVLSAIHEESVRRQLDV